MARVIDRQRAIELRKQGKTHGQIKKELGINKSTLSGWLSEYPLSEKQLDLLKLNKKYSRQ
jgi:transposase-like protein